MPGTTPNLGMYLPGGGSTGNYTPDEVADIDPINQNFVKIDEFAGSVGVQTNRNQQYYGPAAAISSVTGQKLGDEYQESDGNKALWRYDGANWVRNTGGLLLIRPTSVSGTGAVINSRGSVELTNVASAERVNIDGVFDPSKYERYRILHTAYKGGSGSSMSVILRSNAGDLNGTYTNQQIYSINGDTPNGIAITGRPSFETYLDAGGTYVSLSVDLTFAADQNIVQVIGVASGKVGYSEVKTVTVAHSGPNARDTRGIGVNYGQLLNKSKWSFYAYVD